MLALVLFAAVSTATAQSATLTTRSFAGNIYASPQTIGTANAFNSNCTAGVVYAYTLYVNDAISNSTLGVLQGFSVGLIDRQLAQSLYTLTTAEGTLQISGLVALTPPNLEAGMPQRVLAITGGTGEWTGATGTYLETSPSLAPTTSAPAAPGVYNPTAGASTNGVLLTFTYPVTAK